MQSWSVFLYVGQSSRANGPVIFFVLLKSEPSFCSEAQKTATILRKESKVLDAW